VNKEHLDSTVHKGLRELREYQDLPVHKELRGKPEQANKEHLDSTEHKEHKEQRVFLDKIGKKGILLKDSGRMFSTSKCWITYEEVVDDKSRSSSLHKEESPRT